MKEILNTYDRYENYPYSVYLEFCKDEEQEPGTEDSQEYINFVEDSSQWEQEDFFANLKYSNINNYSCVISGTVGKWDGRYEIYPDFTDNLTDAIYEAIGQADDYIISYNAECIQVQGLHHDGRNIFEIRLLSDKGEEEKDKYLYYSEEFNFDNKDNFVTIPEYLF